MGSEVCKGWMSSWGPSDRKLSSGGVPALVPKWN